MWRRLCGRRQRFVLSRQNTPNTNFDLQFSISFITRVKKIIRRIVFPIFLVLCKKKKFCFSCLFLSFFFFFLILAMKLSEFRLILLTFYLWSLTHFTLFFFTSMLCLLLQTLFAGCVVFCLFLFYVDIQCIFICCCYLGRKFWFVCCCFYLFSRNLFCFLFALSKHNKTRCCCECSIVVTQI